MLLWLEQLGVMAWALVLHSLRSLVQRNILLNPMKAR